MATRAPFIVSGTISELSDGLTDNVKYIAQNVGRTFVEYCTTDTEPTAATDIAWHIMQPGTFIQFTPDSTVRVWVRTSDEAINSTIAISEA